MWLNLTFAENLEDHVEAVRRWRNLQGRMARRWPALRLVGGWARQKRGAWHIHAVADVGGWLDVVELRHMAVECGFGQQMKLVVIGKSHGQAQKTPAQIARYIAGYVSGSHNALDVIRDKGVRRMIYVGPGVRRVVLRFDWAKGLGALSRRGQMLWREMDPRHERTWRKNHRLASFMDYQRVHRDFFIHLGFESFSLEQQNFLLRHCVTVAEWWLAAGSAPPVL